MSGDVLLRFLGKGLINVGGDDAKLEKMRGAAAEMAARLRIAPQQTCNFAPVAFDPDVPVDDPVILEATTVLAKHWPTYVNTFAGTPVTVVRAMLLDALVQASDDERIAIGFVSAARNVLPFMDVGSEREIWADVVTNVEARVDARAEEEWATPASIPVPEIRINLDKMQITTQHQKIDRNTLAKSLEAASGPQSKAGNAPTSGNPQWPNSGQPWSYEFVPRATAAIANAIDEATANVSVAPVDLNTPFVNLTKTVQSHATETMASVSRATMGLQHRTNLLWWKEALYSPSARRSYRQMSDVGAAGLMAFDLHKSVPIFSPGSVVAFLRETVVSLGTDAIKGGHKILDLTRSLVTAPEVVPLRQSISALGRGAEGRGPLLALVSRSTEGSFPTEKRFRELVGVPPTATLVLADFAVWVFRELQAMQATTESRAGPQTEA
jgi:hypothetical protein